MKSKLIGSLALFAFVTAASAAPETFDFKDPKGVNSATFKLDATLEAIVGSANGISGTVAFDPAKPAATTGKIVVTSQSLTVPNAMMNGHLHSDKWLDAAKNPEITFEAKELKNVKTQADVTTADVTGTFTCKGISKEITAPVKLTYLKDKMADRLKKPGDLLVLRSTFTIKRSDFDLQPHQNEAVVSDDIEVSLSIVGASPK